MTDLNPSLFADLKVDIPAITESLRRNGPEETSRLLAENISHPDYAIAAGRITTFYLKLSCPKTVQEYLKAVEIPQVLESTTGLTEDEKNLPRRVREKRDEKKKSKPLYLLNDKVYNFIKSNAEALNAMLDHNKDYKYDYFAIKTLMKGYLLKDGKGRIIETPQFSLLRCAAQIHHTNFDACVESYNYMSEGLFTHASPTLFNSGLHKPQLSSCFLQKMKDNLEHIYQTLYNSAMISKHSGGLGIDISEIRHSEVGIGGDNSGIVPMLQVYDKTLRYVDQGGKRKGSGTMYLPPWHKDVYQFINLKKNNGKEEMRARDLHYALWIPDIFMRRVYNKEKWTLMCPNKALGLTDVTEEEFEKTYEFYERILPESDKTVVNAIDLWNDILEAQEETGGPFILFSDTCNRKSNHKELGVISCSNLCTEIIEYSSMDEIASCNLASISVNRFIKVEEKTGKLSYDFEKLGKITKIIVRNLNNVIDYNYVPIKEIKTSNDKHRPLGLGIQGLADTFALLDIAYDSKEARLLNRRIFACIYYNALQESCALAKKRGPHPSFKTTPLAKGKLQFDLWFEEMKTRNIPDELRGKVKADFTVIQPEEFSGGQSWDDLRKDIMEHGVLNSLLVALMPTATSAQILGNNESHEPFTKAMYVRRVLSGEFIVTNRHLVRDLEAINMWNKDVRDEIIIANGSVQTLPVKFGKLAQKKGCYDRLVFLAEKYKTAFELSQKVLLEMEAERGLYVDQSSSHNAFFTRPDNEKLSAYHFYAWLLGVKTGMYYLRTEPVTNALQFTIDAQKTVKVTAPVPTPGLKGGKAGTSPKGSEKEGKIGRSPNFPGKEKKKKTEVICTDEICILCQA